MADACLPVERHAAAELREHELRQRLAQALRALHKIARSTEPVSFDADAPQQYQPSAAIGHIAVIADYALPIAAGRQGFSCLRWQINRQQHRSRRREEIEVQVEYARHIP